MKSRKLLARGIPPAEAARRARLAFGGLEQAKEQCRDAWGGRLVADVLQDLRYGARTLRRSRGFTIATLGSLGAGIGATTAVIVFIDAALLRPLPVREPARLIELMTDRGSGQPANAFSYQALLHFREHATAVDGVVASHNSRLSVSTHNQQIELAAGQYVTGNYFPLLGVIAPLGRTIEPVDDRQDAASVAVLGHAYWTRQFGADRTIIGREISIGGVPFTIVGVAPPGFHGLRVGDKIDLWVPLVAEPRLRTPSWTSSPGYKWLQLVARLKPGTTLEQARPELETLFGSGVLRAEVAMIRQRLPTYETPAWKLVVGSASAGLSMVRRQYGEPLLILFGISAVLLLIACLNVANLQLARASVRRSEMALRCSLGADFSRILRQLLTEGAMLGMLGATLGAGIAYAACHFVLTFFASGRQQFSLDLSPGVRSFVFVAAAVAVTALLSGLLPAWRLGRSGCGALTTGRVHGGRQRRIVARCLIAGQVALSVMMLCAGGLFLRSWFNLRTTDTGFESRSVLLVSTDHSRSGLTPAALRTAFRGALENIAALPGVRSATMADVTPIEGGGTSRTLVVTGRDGVERELRNLHVLWIAPAYFATLKIPIVAGREFSWQDAASPRKVAIVNRAMARRLSADGNVLGAMVTKDGELYEVIGVAGDAKYLELREAAPPTLYLHAAAETWVPGQLAVAAFGDPLDIVSAVREQIRSAAPSVLITSVRTLDQQLDASIVQERMLAAMSAFFAIAGLLLAAIGVYGVLAYSVAQRTAEIGLRIALGATPSRVLGLVVREALLLVGLGLIAGLGGALMFTRTFDALLFNVSPRDAVTLCTVPAVVAAAAIAAAFVPTLRAVRIEPTAALNCGE